MLLYEMLFVTYPGRLPDEAADPIGYGKVPLGFRSGSDSDPDQFFFQLFNTKFFIMFKE
jgi:hypothetical protein